MESLFPQLFFLSYVAPVIIRLAVAGVFFYDTVKIWRSGEAKWPALVWIVFGVLIAVGFLTQLAVLLAALHIVFLAFRKGGVSVFKNSTTAVLALAILLSLFVTGAGGLAFDLPY